MVETQTDNPLAEAPEGDGSPLLPAPHFRAPESSRTIFVVTICAAMGPMAAGVFFFGYRALALAILCVVSCVVLESLYYRVTRNPSMLGRSHAALTGVLLALTLPPLAPWYAAVLGAAFAIIIGKAIFGGVGHFLWQPALVGRLALAVMFGSSLAPTTGPVLAPAHVLTGDVTRCREVENYSDWNTTTAGPNASGLLVERPAVTLRGLTDPNEPRYASITEAVLDVPVIRDALYGAIPGGIGETSAIAIIMAGLYLIYRHYVNWFLPASFLIAATVTASVAPVFLKSGGDAVVTLWLPVAAEGWTVGLTYVSYVLATGELLLAAFFLATEMTSRPVTPRGQVLFGACCGVLAIGLRQYVLFPLSAYIAVIVMNTFTPTLERFTRPRVLGKPTLIRRALRRIGLTR